MIVEHAPPPLNQQCCQGAEISAENTQTRGLGTNFVGAGKIWGLELVRFIQKRTEKRENVSIVLFFT
jgi:hypothetical protein